MYQPYLHVVALSDSTVVASIALYNESSVSVSWPVAIGVHVYVYMPFDYMIGVTDDMARRSWPGFSELGW